MKRIWKKFACMLSVLVCVCALSACGGTKEADAEIDGQMKTILITTAQGLSEAVVVVTDEELENYKNSGDDFTKGVMEAWETAKDELGESAEFGEPQVSRDGTGFEVLVPAKFKKADAEFIYAFDRMGSPTSLTINVNYSMAENMKRAGMNTLMGIGIVFCMLIFLSFIISLFRLIPDPEKKKQASAPAPVPAPAASAPAVVEAPKDDTELIAVITAAIAAAEGTSPDGFVVRSIRKVNRRKW